MRPCAYVRKTTYVAHLLAEKDQPHRPPPTHMAAAGGFPGARRHSWGGRATDPEQAGAPECAVFVHDPRHVRRYRGAFREWLARSLHYRRNGTTRKWRRRRCRGGGCAAAGASRGGGKGVLRGRGREGRRRGVSDVPRVSRICVVVVFVFRLGRGG